MDLLPGWSTDQLQTAASLVGATTGVAALLVSGLALWFAQAGNRAAAMVLTWTADNRVILENRGPSAAKSVHLEVTSPSNRERAADLADMSPHMRFEVIKSIERLPVGFSYQDHMFRAVGETGDYIARLTWRDGRFREQSLELPLDQESSAPFARERQVVSDRQVEKISDGLSSGIARALKSHLRGY